MVSGGWQQLTLTCPEETAGRLSNLLELAEPVSFSFPVSAGNERCLQALFEADRDLEGLKSLLLEAGARALKVEWLPDQDWLAASREAWQPMPMGNGIWVGPGWCEPPADARLYLRIEPGQAFGTGRHATTRLCLQWLIEHADEGYTSLIDFGCGSGVLAIAAARLGVTGIIATDIDPLCLAATADNAAANDVADRIRIVAPAELAGPPAGLLLANILLRPLLVLAPRLAGLVADGGCIVLSGIMRDQMTGCRTAYEPWFDFDPPRFDGEWALLCGRRRDVN
jgi:ribosomal protein L11 methyltransferase